MRSILLVRHGLAADRADSADDAQRPLTEEGVRKTARAGRGFARLASPELLLTSPLLRARQTAELFAQAIEPTPKVRALAELAGIADFAAVLRAVNRQKASADGTVALVGHEPDMGRLVSYLLAGHTRLRVRFKKAAACRIDVDRQASAGRGELVWLIPAGGLIALGRRVRR